VNVHVFRLWPPLEHAPDQTASRPSNTVEVIGVPVLNEAEPELPTLTLITAGRRDALAAAARRGRQRPALRHALLSVIVVLGQLCRSFDEVSDGEQPGGRRRLPRGTALTRSKFVPAMTDLQAVDFSQLSRIVSGPPRASGLSWLNQH